MYYVSWRQWIPYQVDGKLKVFSGNSRTTKPLTHILPIPIFTTLIKIFPIPYGTTACGEFTFIGCHSPRDDLCTEEEKEVFTDCIARKLPPQCSLGFIGNGHICRDLNECDVKTGAYCDRNSLCRNKHGSFTCDPCKNSFIGDGRICQTSCEAMGITCGANSYCDVDECKCYEGFIQNGTRGCVDDPTFEKANEPPTAMQPDEIDGLCPDGFFNCYGDVVGTIDKLRKATMMFEHFDYHDDCNN
ncbi:fibrillin-1-like [Dendronephthya gigantea]|uniref:fibrillin-1-like n=1 Tax=Dendronephthya gigantea TaxID=151771 RepID=UPI0010690ED5|nr:fibrillin-1-like [Dendronephthya gigantea]XP_028394292.1 fibrillin-1-like [Dendronephthya gigantea]